jgi:hypothetical protein
MLLERLSASELKKEFPAQHTPVNGSRESCRHNPVEATPLATRGGSATLMGLRGWPLVFFFFFFLKKIYFSEFFFLNKKFN